MVKLIIMFILGGIIVISPINVLIHELIHKLSLSKLGVKSEIFLNFYYFKFEVEKLKWSFVSNKKERTFGGDTIPVWNDFNKCNKKQKIKVYLLPTVILTITTTIILIGYLIIFKQSIINHFSILILNILFFELCLGKEDFEDSYKILFN